jgi:hypothetical protein
MDTYGARSLRKPKPRNGLFGHLLTSTCVTRRDALRSPHSGPGLADRAESRLQMWKIGNSEPQRKGVRSAAQRSGSGTGAVVARGPQVVGLCRQWPASPVRSELTAAEGLGGKGPFRAQPAADTNGEKARGDSITAGERTDAPREIHEERVDHTEDALMANDHQRLLPQCVRILRLRDCCAHPIES